MSQLPNGAIGDAVGVLIYTFICLFSNILLIWLHWTSRERLGYVALIAYFVLLCTISSIIQQIYNYVLWDDLMRAQLEYIKANYENADVIFNNGNFGFMKDLANIRLFCYIMESSYFFSYTIHVAFSVYGFWSAKRRTERRFLWGSKVIPLILAGITIGLLQTPPVQSSFLVYMIVANVQSVTSCALSILLIFAILWKYIDVKRFVGHTDSSRTSTGWGFLRRRSNSRTDSRARRISAVPFANNWLVVRLSIAVLLISVFIFASLFTHLPQRDDVAKDAKAESADLSPERARSNIVGYIYGVTPALAIWLIFGLTQEFRQIMYERLVPLRWQSGSRAQLLPLNASHASKPSQSRLEAEVEIHLGDIDPNVQRHSTPI